ncbi:hypothetical protein PAPYR_12881 [Paratrimastix pyriformis]|uniref:Uncharacterized protein n=1 Tax=Paratrimastix pyriformis TaxID=342808 RepID=A0ABQ8U695_9EUKA|nr:hypothetical protein PAPYR_12881 [Paratrimastix pyriformis]
MIHALAAVRMAAPGATETLLAGSEALDHIGRAVAQAMDPHALPVDPQPMMAAMGSDGFYCRSGMWRNGPGPAGGASLCSRCGHATSWESPGPFIPVEALDTAFSSKCLCGGKRHDICALHAAPLIAVSTDGVLAGSARQALHAAAVSIGGIRYRLVACLSHQGSPRSGHEVAIIPSSTPDTYHVLSGTERTVVDENEAAVGVRLLLLLADNPAAAAAAFRNAGWSPGPPPTIPAVGLVVKALAQAAPKATTAPTAQTTPAAPSAINPSLAGAGPSGPQTTLRGLPQGDAAEGAISAATGRYPAVCTRWPHSLPAASTRWPHSLPAAAQQDSCPRATQGCPGTGPLLELRGLPECMAAKPTTVRQSGLAAALGDLCLAEGLGHRPLHLHLQGGLVQGGRRPKPPPPEEAIPGLPRPPALPPQQWRARDGASGPRATGRAAPPISLSGRPVLRLPVY